jgi:fermentation-respiration switch protein FrsA (DUF1100 family)
VPSGNPPDPGDGGYPALAETICRENRIVFIFNFRGAGESGGNFDMPGWGRDLLAVIDYLWDLPDIARPNLTLVGFSAGGATSIYVASQDERVSAVAACASPAEFSFITGADVERFRRIGIIRDAGFPQSVEAWLDGFRRVTPLHHVAGIAPRPLLLVHGDLDETVPLEHAYRLYERAGEPKRLVVIEGAGHRLRQDARAIGTVFDWLRSLPA